MSTKLSPSTRITRRRWQTAAATLLLLGLLLGPQPAAAAPQPQPTVPYVHIVRPGETLADIASLYGVSVQELRSANQLSNRATVLSCTPNNDSTQTRGTVRLNGRPVSGYGVVFNWRPDGNVVARTSSGGGGEFDFILRGAGPREGNWWFWIENKDGKRISEMAHARTDRRPHAGMCQRLVIDFDIRDPGLTYVGRKLRVTVGGEVTAAWMGAFYANRELKGDPVLSRQDASLRFDWQGGQPGPRVSGDNFSAAWTTTRRFQAGAYRFFARADDGVRLYVDDVLVLADWNIHPATQSLGYGAASASPDSVRVSLYVGEEPSYGPGGPDITFVQPADLEEVQELLIEQGVDGETIEVDIFSSDYDYSSSKSGKVSFIYSDVAGLRAMLQAVLDEAESRRGPIIEAARLLFMVENCAALEEEAMQAALNNARARAARMAAQLEMTPGPIRAVSEDISSTGVSAPAGGCIALESLETPVGFFRNADSAATNSINEVEVAISLKATFALEPAR